MPSWPSDRAYPALRGEVTESADSEVPAAGYSASRDFRLAPPLPGSVVLGAVMATNGDTRIAAKNAAPLPSLAGTRA